MGQVLSNILSCILCDEEAKDELERPSETSKLLISPANRHVLQAKPSTNVSQLLPQQTRLSSSRTLGSCSDSGNSYVSNPPQLFWNNKSSDTEQNRPQNQSRDILISLLGESYVSNPPRLNKSSDQVIFPILSSKAVVIEEKWMKHYSSCQKILLVGEGDFSFSASLAVAFGSATNIIATSLNSEGFLSRNYRNAMSNIQSLKSGGAKVMHDVDATEMANLFLFEGKTFDRIVYNFPHAGFINNESKESQLRRHQKLVRLFMANAKRMITKDGEIHVTHKSNPYFFEWNLRQLGSSEGLRLIKEVHFNFKDYPGYYPKYGYGGDKNFNCNPSKTYKFGLQIRGCSPYA